jgi:phytoene dehydrogenase-like protein
MTIEADVVVAGAGHNSLITAAYIAMSGRSVVIVDARAIPGGGASTEEALLPGFFVDMCSTGHTLLTENPLMTGDELGLIGKFRLTYVDPDPVAHVAFPDGDTFTLWLDVERTCAEFARFSKADALAYRRLLQEWDSVKDVFRESTFNPPGFGPSVDEGLRKLPNGNAWLRRKALSAWDVIKHEFESRHVRAFLMWQAFQTMTHLDLPGSGALAYSIVAGRQKRSWTMPVGGSGKLVDALVATIQSYDGKIFTGKKVERLIVEGGRCKGFVTHDGERYVGREAVVSTIHVKHLIDMAPKELWGESFTYGVETYDTGIPAFAIYLCTSQAPQFVTSAGTQTSVSAGIAGWGEDLVRVMRQIRDGEAVRETPWVLIATPTLADRGRAPVGHHVVKLLAPCGAKSFAPSGNWADAKDDYARLMLKNARRVVPNLNDEVIKASLFRSPVEIEAENPHMIGGAYHGGDRGIPYSGGMRPAPGWAQHRMPIPGLYQTGGTTHPGGSITGAPGRNAAQVILKDFGTSIEDVVARTKARSGKLQPAKASA